MDRPPSQLENARPSGIKPPSRLPAMTGATSRTLLETSQSDLNARSTRDHGTMPPPTAVVKHKMNGLPEPAPKRKTLAERAGEPIATARSHLPQTFRHTGMTAQAAARGGANPFNGYQYRGPPSSTSTNSSTSSVRLASGQNGSRLNARQPSAIDALDQEEDAELEAGPVGKRKGTPILSLNPRNISLNKITFRKTRAQGECHQPHQYPTESRSQHPGSYTRSGEDDAPSRVEEHVRRMFSDLSLQKELDGQASRSASLASAMAGLSITPSHRKTSGTSHTPSLERIKEEISPSKIPKFSCTPSLRHAHSTQALRTPSPLKQKGFANGLRTPAVNSKRRDELPVFLTKEKLTPVTAWDTKGRLEDMEQLFAGLQSQMNAAADSKKTLEESIELYKSRVQELSQLNRELTSESRATAADLERARNDLHMTTSDLRQARRDHEREQQDLERRHEKAIHDVRSSHEKDMQKVEREGERTAERLEVEVKATKESMEKQVRDEIADLTSAHWEELDEMKTQHECALSTLKAEIAQLRKSDEGRAAESATQVQSLRDTTASLQAQAEASAATVVALRSQISAAESRSAALEHEKAGLISKAHFLEGNQEAQSLEFTTMTQRLQDAEAKAAAVVDQLRKEETARRRLNALVLELKGNIRVFARTRPILNGEEGPAKVEYPDAGDLDGNKEMVVHAPTTFSATGKERNEKYSYGFDRVFAPNAANHEVFDDCRDLVQSVVDGYNVSIMSYGQTGSGKTFGMSGVDGIIPSSIALLLSEIQRVKEKGWEYIVEASFVEVYNETLNDLLGDAKTWDNEDDVAASAKNKRKEKHEIHHDAVTGRTTVTNLTAVALWPPPADDASWPPAVDVDGSACASSATYTHSAVSHLLETATKNRRVAATKANERSSRSHSVFILTLRGFCEATGENSEGILNLVDLAGSERLKQSGAEGSRAKETAAINTSLKSLGDVIEKVGSGGHIPYRNSKLTYLLQSSLGGTTASGKSSRTLMLLHLSPLQAHWQETKTSLQFGAKVHGTHIGAAKKK